MVDFARMKQAGQLAQFFAVFLPFPGAFEKLGLPPMTDEAYIQTLRQWLLQKEMVAIFRMLAMLMNR